MKTTMAVASTPLLTVALMLVTVGGTALAGFASMKATMATATKPMLTMAITAAMMAEMAIVVLFLCWQACGVIWQTLGKRLASLRQGS